MSEINEIFDPTDRVKIKAEIEKEDAKLPCNIWGYIKELKEKLEELEARIIELEK